MSIIRKERDKDCGVLLPDSPVPHFRKQETKKMCEVSLGFWEFIWFDAGYGKFGMRRGWQGRIADYLETHLGYWQEPRPTWDYQDASVPHS